MIATSDAVVLRPLDEIPYRRLTQAVRRSEELLGDTIAEKIRVTRCDSIRIVCSALFDGLHKITVIRDDLLDMGLELIGRVVTNLEALSG